MRFRILGPLEVSDDDRPRDVGATERRALVAPPRNGSSLTRAGT